MAGPQDPAAGGDRLRASHADREQVIEVLKDAFVQGRLTRDELDARAGQALAARTYAELAVLTADIPAGPADAPPARQPARAQNRVPQTHSAGNAVAAWAFPVTAVIFMALMMLGFYERSLLPIMLACSFVTVALPCATVTARRQRRSRGQLPPRPGPGGEAPEFRGPGQVGHDPALPPDRTDHTRAGLQARKSRQHRRHTPARAGRAPGDARPASGMA